MDVLMSIRPEFVEKIKRGEKRYEYRRRMFAKKIKRIYIYSSSPQKRIVGFFEWSGVIKGTVNNVWNWTREYSGVEEKQYNEYFKGLKEANALKISQLHMFEKMINPWKYPTFEAPQSYLYFKNKEDELYEELCNMVQKAE